MKGRGWVLPEPWVQYYCTGVWFEGETGYGSCGQTFRSDGTVWQTYNGREWLDVTAEEVERHRLFPWGEAEHVCRES